LSSIFLGDKPDVPSFVDNSAKDGAKCDSPWVASQVAKYCQTDVDFGRDNRRQFSDCSGMWVVVDDLRGSRNSSSSRYSGSLWNLADRPP